MTIETYETRVTGVHSGITVYDETIEDEPSSQAVQDAEEAARDAIVAAGGDVGSITGPTLVSSDRTLEDSSTASTTEFDRTEETISTSFAVGPTTIMVGEDQSVSCVIPAGHQNFNDNTHTETYEDVTSTTTNTYLNSAHYQLTDSGASQPNLWQDVDCDGEVTTRDNQTLLRFVLQQPPLSQTQPCPTVGATVNVATFAPYPWGDGDCDAENTTRDNQATLRYVLEQPPLSQTQPCPDIGQGVTITTPG